MDPILTMSTCGVVAGRGTDILLGGSPKGLTLSVLEYALGPELLRGADHGLISSYLLASREYLG